MDDIRPNSSLPTEAARAVWRLFGNGESPLRRETTFGLIEKVLGKHVPQLKRGQVVAEVRGWFELHGDQRLLKDEMLEPVAHLILDGVRDALSTRNGLGDRETAFCAVGSIEPDTAATAITSSWSREELDAFTKYTFRTLKALSLKAGILDANRIQRLEGVNAKAHLKPDEGDRGLKFYWELQDSEWWLHSCVANMVELLVKLNPDNFPALIESIDHPVVQIRAARCVVDGYESAHHRKPLDWLSGTPTDALVALAAIHILGSINSLDSEFRWQEGRVGEYDVLDPDAFYLLSGLVDRLSKLEPIRCARWVVELLSYGMFILNAQGRSEKPRRVEQLEELCTPQLEGLVLQHWSDELLDNLRVGLCLTPMVPRILPIAQVAFDIRIAQPARSVKLARLILEAHELQIAEKSDNGRTFFYDMGYWADRDLVSGLCTALVLSDEDLDLQEWVSDKCHALPLSAWDAEENYDRFLAAEKVAQFRFLVALYATRMLPHVGRADGPTTAVALSERLWTHCQFIGRYIDRHLEGSDVAERAAQIAISLGEPGDEWVLKQARHPGVGPRTLWALLDQYTSNGDQGIGPNDEHRFLVVAELRHIVSERFGDVRGLHQAELYYLGKLWLLLEGSAEAYQTAMAIVSLSQQKLSRAHKTIALKLLAYAASEQRLVPEAENKIASLYNELWSSYTPTEERADRQQIDELLKR